MPFTYLGGTDTAFLDATEPTQVKNKAPHQQETNTSCWLNCTKHIINFYSSQRAAQPIFREDTQLGDVNVMGSAVENLLSRGHFPAVDQYRTPDFESLRESIDAGKPLLVQVGRTNSKFVAARANKSAKGGHFMVIVGYEAKQDANNTDKIAVFDPNDGDIHHCEFNRTHVTFGDYQNDGWVYNNTSHVDDYTGAASTQGSSASSSSSSSSTPTPNP